MAFSENWLRHLLASINGENVDDLVRDFWDKDEDLWARDSFVRWRWAKLFCAYSMAGIAQIVLPLLIAGIVIIFFTDKAWIWLLIGVGIGFIGAILLGAWGATGTCIELRNPRD